MLASLLSLLAACSSQTAPNPNGYLGYLYGFYGGQLLLAGHIRDIGKDFATCQAEVKEGVKELQAQAPDGVSVTGVCYPIPDAPPPVHKPATSSSDSSSTTTDGSQSIVFHSQH